MKKRKKSPLLADKPIITLPTNNLKNPLMELSIEMERKLKNLKHKQSLRE